MNSTTRNYQTNFHSYLTPFPDIYSIGPNVNYFAQNGVKGIFQEGSYNGPGGDMAELRDWVTAKMVSSVHLDYSSSSFNAVFSIQMWDPQSDPDLLIATFLSGYYGAPAATHMRAYLDVMHGAVVNTSYFMRESFDGIRPAFLTPDVLLRSATALSAAKAASASNHLHQAHVNRSTIGTCEHLHACTHRLTRPDFASCSGVARRFEPLRRAAYIRSHQRHPMADGEYDAA